MQVSWRLAAACAVSFAAGYLADGMSVNWALAALVLALSGLAFTAFDVLFSAGRQMDALAALEKESALSKHQAKIIAELEDEANALREKLRRAQLDNAVLQANAADG